MCIKHKICESDSHDNEYSHQYSELNVDYVDIYDISGAACETKDWHFCKENSFICDIRKDTEDQYVHIGLSFFLLFCFFVFHLNRIRHLINHCLLKKNI